MDVDGCCGMLMMLWVVRDRVHYLQFPEGVLNRHYEKLVQCDPRLKALVEGTLSGSGARHESIESGVECQSVVQHGKARNGMAHVYDGLNDRPHSPLSPLSSPLSPYSQMQGRGSCPGMVEELESDVMRRNEQSSPSSGRHLLAPLLFAEL